MSQAVAKLSGELRLRACKVNLASRRVHRRDGTALRLTSREAELLAHLRLRKGVAVSRAELLQEVWGYAPNARTRTIDSTVARLRAKIELDSKEPDHLQSVIGVGYRLLLEAPELPSGLVGRSKELAQAMALLRQGAALTLVGVGGQGKTTLARELARQWTGPLVLVDLSHQVDLDGACALILRIAGAQAAADPAAAVQRLWRTGPDTLWVLDNCEDIRAELAPLVQGGTAAGGRFLLTSRVALGFPAERILPLPPMDHASAVVLFEQQLGSQLQPADRPLVDRLAGHPLSLTIAGARARLLSTDSLRTTPEALLGSLGGPLTQPARQLTLRSILESSWSLLKPHQQTWAELAWLGQGAVSGLGTLLSAPPDSWMALRAHGLLRLDSGRFSMPELVAAFGRHQGGPPHALTQRALAAAVQWLDALEGPQPGPALQRLRDLHPFLSARLETLRGPDAHRALHALSPLQVAAGGPSPGALERVLAEPGPPELRALTLLRAARAQGPQGAQSAQGHLLQALDLTPAGPVRARCLRQLALVESYLQRKTQALERVEEAVQCAAGDPGVQAEALLVQASLQEHFHGVDPRTDYEAARRAAQSADAAWPLALAQCLLAARYDVLADPELQGELWDESLDLLEALGDQRRSAVFRLLQVRHLQHRGQLERAQDEVQALLLGPLADPGTPARTTALHQLGLLSLDLERYSDAARQIQALRRAPTALPGPRQADLADSLELRLKLLTEPEERLPSVLAQQPATPQDGRLLAALRGEPLVPAVPKGSISDRRDSARWEAVLGTLNGDSDHRDRNLDLLERLTRPGHLQLQTDLAVLRGHPPPATVGHVARVAQRWRHRAGFS